MPLLFLGRSVLNTRWWGDVLQISPEPEEAVTIDDAPRSEYIDMQEGHVLT
jgi:hypothetical protein